MVFSGRTDGRKAEKVGLAFSPYAWKRLVDFASAHRMCITITLFPHKAIHQATWYPPDMNAKPSLKDYVLVRHRLRPSVMDTRVFRGGT